jgi:hypothetical protein
MVLLLLAVGTAPLSSLSSTETPSLSPSRPLFPLSSFHITNAHPIRTAVTHAALSNWEYMDIIRQYAPSQCSDHLVNSIKTIDHILIGSNGIPGGGKWAKWGLKKVFGLEGLSRDEDFAGVIEVSVRIYTTQCEAGLGTCSLLHPRC